MFIPNATMPNVGTVIHVKGNLLGGFEHEFKRNYGPEYTTSVPRILDLGYVLASAVVDYPASAARVTDTTPIDRLEEEALQVPAPGPSMRSASARTNVPTVSFVSNEYLYLTYRIYLIRLALLSKIVRSG